MTDFEALLACYRSGQVSERQWQAHLEDKAFREWVESLDETLRASGGFGSTGIAAEKCCVRGGTHSWQWDPRIENDRCVNCGTIRQ